jgi:hypothetical protein
MMVVMVVMIFMVMGVFMVMMIVMMVMAVMLMLSFSFRACTTTVYEVKSEQQDEKQT